jgi:hypothetical protein
MIVNCIYYMNSKTDEIIGVNQNLLKSAHLIFKKFTKEHCNGAIKNKNIF